MKKTLAIIAIIILVPFVIWNITFQFYISIVLVILMGLGILLWRKYSKTRYIFMAILLGLVLYLSFLPITLSQLKNTQRNYISRVCKGKHLNTIEKFNIYGLNVLASTVAYTIFPEVAKEAFLMIFKDTDEIRKFESDFFLDSNKIQIAVKSGKKTGKVRWYKKDYSNSEARVSLALNICNYKILNNGKVQVWVDVNYPKRNEVVVGNNFLKVTVDEGLFRYLVDEGWLHRYTAIWTSKSKVL